MTTWGRSSLRLGRWKLHVPGPSAAVVPALYDLSGDLGEATDLAAVHPDRVKAMLSALATWETALEAPRWRYRRARR